MVRKKVETSNQAGNDVCFEEALAKLELIVKELETGELPLETALEKFADGVSLSQACLKRLNAAEKAIDKILRDDKGRLEEQPLVLREEDK